MNLLNQNRYPLLHSCGDGCNVCEKRSFEEHITSALHCLAYDVEYPNDIPFTTRDKGEHLKALKAALDKYRTQFKKANKGTGRKRGTPNHKLTRWVTK